jgi:hypothetical protein
VLKKSARAPVENAENAHRTDIIPQREGICGKRAGKNARNRYHPSKGGYLWKTILASMKADTECF